MSSLHMNFFKVIISNRIAIKVDISKAFDTVIWTFGYFKGQNGLRQGNMLSLILSIIIMTVLSTMLDRAAAVGQFDYHPM